MPNIAVDHEKLAHGLEKGLRSLRTFDRSAFMIYERQRRFLLRQPACGVISVAIAEHARTLGLNSVAYITGPSCLDIDPRMEHVIPWIFPDKDSEPLIIDANYQQFFGYVGMSQRYEKVLGKRFFPDDPVVSFLASQTSEVVGRMTEIAADFQRVNMHPTDEFGLDIADGVLANASEDQLYRSFSQIYDLDSYRPWRPADYLSKAAVEVSRHIMPESIQLP